jgi:catechol 2,3-dioxygenase-like lactoylglutathione lyase family enzyme
LVSLEFVVPDLDACLKLFNGAMGMEIVGRGRHDVIDAEIAQVAAGDIVITFLQPTDTGVGVFHSSPAPRLSQLNFEVPPGEMDQMCSEIEEAGAAVVERSEALFYVDAKMIEELLGAETSLVFFGQSGSGPGVEE